MKTVIMGSGAMGSLFGGFLSRSGEDVWLVDIREDHIQALGSAGLIVEEGGKKQTIPVHATKGGDLHWKSGSRTLLCESLSYRESRFRCLSASKGRYGIAHPPEWSWK